MIFKDIDIHNRKEINTFIKNQWYTTTMVIRKKEYDLTKAEGIVVYENDKIIGLITYIIYGENNDTLEILSLDSLIENKGIGTELVSRVVNKAKENKCKRVVLITTNDNLHALRFYQKRNFGMINLFVGNVDWARKIKPEIPLLGNDDIPLKHEIELEMKL